VVQRVPLGPGRSQIAPPIANAINARAPVARSRIPSVNIKRVSRVAPPTIIVQAEDDDIQLNEPQSEMDVEEDVMTADREAETEVSLLSGEQEVEAMVGVESSEDEEVTQPRPTKVQRIWPDVTTDRRIKCEKEVQAIREVFQDEVDMYDTTMVSEYAEEIFEYMCELEVRIISQRWGYLC
jgi:G2/mitotic-specific cyclin 2